MDGAPPAEENYEALPIDDRLSHKVSPPSPDPQPAPKPTPVSANTRQADSATLAWPIG